MKHEISPNIDLKEFLQRIEGYNFNNKLGMAYISPFSKSNINELPPPKHTSTNENENTIGYLVIISGKLELSIDYVNYTFNSSSWVELRPTAEVKLIGYSNDFMAYIVTAAESFVLDTLLDKKPIPISHFVDMKESPHLELTSDELTALKMSLDRILYYLRREHSFKKDMLHNTFYNFILEASHIFHNRDGVRKQLNNLSRKETIIRDFLVLVEQNAQNEHNPSFYSDKLCISTQYLSIVLKEVTGHTANYWIAKKITSEAKILLRTPRLTIKEITDKLHFADQSSFGKFFKKHTGISPKKYREDFSSPR
ncbi:MAG: AraC family transcriptional regulator [Bacteroidales bacterium]|nr:AraC family transcriptional regulator [Bacteroidales bacterium]